MNARALEADARHAVALAAEALIDGLTNCAQYPSGKWQAGGTDETIGKLTVAVTDWQKARAAVEQEEADAAMPQEWHDAQRFINDTLR